MPGLRSKIAGLSALMLFAFVGMAHAQIKQAQVPYNLADIEPAIDNQTMVFHYRTHYSTYVNNTNAALANATGLQNKSNLTALIMSITTLPSPLNNTIRNQGGGAWNHALYFKHLASPGSSATQTSSISSGLQGAINSSFGSVDAMKAQMTEAATKVFGSGWAWLCYTGGSTPLVVTSTPNQDNPLMGSLPGAPAVKSAGCTPILGIDVWEHAYYLKHGPKRAAYLSDFWTAVNWQQVSKNFDQAKAGKAEAMVSNPVPTPAQSG
jgi:Fe-Mn family superoxide dismutase